MGLLDNLFSDDPKQQAIMAMAFGLLGGAPNGRKNFGADVMNAGLLGSQTYGNAQMMRQKMAEQALRDQLTKQQISMGGINLQNAQQDAADQQQARDILKNRGGMQQQPPQNMSLDQGPTPSLYGGPVAPFGAPQGQPPPMPQGMPQGPSSPSVVPFGKGQALASTPPAAAGEGKFATFNKYNSLADEFESKGLMKQAQQFRDQAEKFRPKLKDEQVRLQGGKPVVVRNYEDGTTEVSPFDPTAKVNYLNTGGSQIGINEYTGLPTGNGLKNTMTPGEVASNSVAQGNLGIAKQRLAYDTGIGTPGGASALPPAVQAQIAKSQAEGLNTGGITYKNNLDTTVQTGNDLMTRIAESRKALEQFKPGMGTENFLNIARAAQAMHAPDGMVTAIAGGSVPAIQEFQKLSAQQAMETLKSAMGGSGRITQAEFKVFQQNNPNIELDPGAIKKIYDFAEKTHKRNVAEQAGLNSYIKEGGNISQWPTEWTKRTGGGFPPVNGFRYLGKE